MTHNENHRPARQYLGRRRGATQAGSSQTGSSLLETLIAAGLLLVIAVAIFPMFHRAVANNFSGSESTQATQHGKTEVENLFAVPLDSDFFDMLNPLPDHTVESEGTSDKMTLGTFYWDPQANVTGSVDPSIPLAPGAWIDNPGDAVGILRWERTATIRQYSYADIAGGVIDAATGTALITLGHPELFDNPLAKDAPTSQVNFREEDVTVDSRRPGVPSFRTRFWRSF